MHPWEKLVYRCCVVMTWFVKRTILSLSPSQKVSIHRSMVPAIVGPFPRLVSAVYPATITTFLPFNLNVLISFCLHVYILISTTACVFLVQSPLAPDLITLRQKQIGKKEKGRVGDCWFSVQSPLAPDFQTKLVIRQTFRANYWVADFYQCDRMPCTSSN